MPLPVAEGFIASARTAADRSSDAVLIPVRALSRPGKAPAHVSAFGG